MSERRIFARHTPTALTYVSAGAANGGILLNVSEAGCALQLISPPPKMSDVTLELDLGSSLPHVEVSGKVIWADDTGCTGIRFYQLSEAARQTIRRFVDLTPADPTMHEIGMGLDPLLANESEEGLFDSLDAEPFESRLQELSTGGAFVAIVEECRNATGATASALAMLKGRDMVCRASCGKGAPPNGARLDITSERSFTAQCVSTATTLRCVDSQIDPRVNAQVCQRLGIRSVTAMPLMHGGHVVGVLEVFSAERNAFHDGHIAALENIGRIAVEFAISRHEITLSSSQPVPSWPVTSQPAAPRERPTTTPPSLGQPVNRPGPQFGSSFTGAAAVAVAPASTKESITAAGATGVTIQQPQVAGAKPAQTASGATYASILSTSSSHPSAPANVEKKLERPELQGAPRPAIATVTSSASLTNPTATMAPSHAPSSSGKSAAPSVMEALAAKSSSAPAPGTVAKPAPAQRREPETSAAAQPSQPAKVATAPKLQPKAQRIEIAPFAEEPIGFVGFEYSAATPGKEQPLFQEHTDPARGKSKGAVIGGGAVAVLLIAGLGVWQFLRSPSTSPQAIAAPLSSPQTDNAASTPIAAAPPVSTVETTSISTPKDSAGTSKNAKPKEPSNPKSDDSVHTIETKSRSAVIRDRETVPEPKVIALAQSERLQSPPTSPVAPPRITTSSSLPTLLTGAPAPSLPSFRVVPTTPSGPLRVSSTAITDHLIRKVDPIYPEMARRSGVSGAVRLRLEIGVDGKVTSATVVDGAAVLAASAKDAVLQWRYRPYMVDSKPVPIETEIVVRFTGR